jgi:5-methylcytosine-specific restriction endonuclease McrA
LFLLGGVLKGGDAEMRTNKTYAEKLLDPRWQQLRLRVFARDEWSCRTCHKTTETLHAHHVHYHPLAEGPWDYDIDSIITLCANCHSDEHADLESAKANLILALTKKGYVTSYDFDCFTTLIETFGKP